MVKQEKVQINKRLYLIYSIVFVIALIILGITGTYAFFRVTVTKSETLGNVAASLDCINITYSETGTIDLDYQYPVSDSYAQSNVVPLTVNVTNNCSSNIDDVNYVLTIATLAEDGYINDNQMRIQVKRKIGSDTEEIFKTPGYLSSLAKLEIGNTYNYMLRDLSQRNDTKDYTVKTIYRIDNNIIGAGETNTYKIYLWIDYWEGDTTKTGLNDNATMEKDFKATVSLVINSYQTKEIDIEFAGDGTENNPYQIRMIEDLVKLSQSVNNGTNYSGKYFKLIRDLDFNSKESYENADRIDFGDVNGNGTSQSLIAELTTSSGFKGIGISRANSFKGTFNGNNKEIRNLYINNSTASSIIGFFGALNGATIENLTVDGNVTTSTHSNLGGIVGTSYGIDNIINCHNKVNVISTMSNNWYVGGIVGGQGSGTLTITNSINSGNVQNGERLGGLIGGVNNSGTTLHISNSYNEGTLTNNTGANTGGLIGTANAGTIVTISNSYNLSDISNDQTKTIYVGGIAGQILGQGTIEYSYNNADLKVNYNTVDSNNSNTKLVGGLVGNGKTIVINNSYNTGNIFTVSNNLISLGGLVGQITNSLSVNNSYNNGNVSSAASISNNGIRVAGILASELKDVQNVTVRNSYNSGNISGGTVSGGIIGQSMSPFIIDNCHNTGNVYTETYYSQNENESISYTLFGGLVGHHTKNQGIDYGESYVLNSFNSGNVIGATETNTDLGGGLVGDNVGNRPNELINVVNIINSYNVGNVMSSLVSAGLVYDSFYGYVNFNNVFNNGSVQNNYNAIIYRADNSSSEIEINFNNVYYNNINHTAAPSNSYNGTATSMSSAEFNSSSFVDTLNNNLNSINLSSYGLDNTYSLNRWKMGSNGYPVFDD